jgi:hypothetical protein
MQKWGTRDEKIRILRGNSPNLDRRIREAERELEGARNESARVSRGIYAKCERFAASTGHYMTRGQRTDDLYMSTLQDDRDARCAESWLAGASEEYRGWYRAAYNWAGTLNLEEARSTNLDEKLKIE